MAGKQGFGYTEPSKEKREGRRFELTPEDWIDLLQITEVALQNSCNISLYTSRDQNALCVSLKQGNTSAKYWCGPDDDMRTVLTRLRKEWNIQNGPNNIAEKLYNMFEAEFKGGR